MNLEGHAMFRLRGHHLLCLLGYQGMGYSAEYAENMTRFHQTLRSQPDTEILLVFGPDDLCDKFPHDQPSHCNESNVHQRDSAILNQLGVKIGQVWKWSTLERTISENVVPEDIPRFCSTCPWLSYGVCEKGVDRIKAGMGLSIIES